MAAAFEYFTGVVSIFATDSIVVHVVNTGAANQTVRIVIYRGTSGTIEYDSDVLTVTPNSYTGIGHTPSTNDNYWVRILADSKRLVPKASFERDVSGVWIPVVSYRPGDFALFTV